LIEKAPKSLALLDFRENPLLENENSRNLVQFLMSKLFASNPNTEYEILKSLSPRETKPRHRTRAKSPQSRKSQKSISMAELTMAMDNLPKKVSAGKVGYVPWRTAGKSVERKTKLVTKKFGVGSTETQDSDSDPER
jgi:hypothetical protein